MCLHRPIYLNISADNNLTQYAQDTIKKWIMCEKRTLKKMLTDIYNVHYKTNNKGVAIEVKLRLWRFYFWKEEKRMGIGQKLQIIDVSKFYGTFQALDRVNLECGAGEFVTILGSSGSGKTTLLKAIAGFEQSSSGIILINNEDVAGKNRMTEILECFSRIMHCFPI